MWSIRIDRRLIIVWLKITKYHLVIAFFAILWCALHRVDKGIVSLNYDVVGSFRSCSPNAHAYMLFDLSQYALACTVWNIRIIMACKSWSPKVHAQLQNRQRNKTDLNVPKGGDKWNTVLYIWELLLFIYRAEWMKGVCHKWSRGRHFSPSLPGDRYLNLGSPQKRPPGRNLGEHRLVRRSGATSRGTVVLVFRLRMRIFPWTEVLTIFMGKMFWWGKQR